MTLIGWAADRPRVSSAGAGALEWDAASGVFRVAVSPGPERLHDALPPARDRADRNPAGLNSRGVERRGRSPLAAAAWALVAASRAVTLAPDPWEWDEILFANAVRDGIDLSAGGPHAPGYPLFVEAAGPRRSRARRRFGRHARRGLPEGSSRRWRSRRSSSPSGYPSPARSRGGALYAFVPAVWLHAGRPLSDAPAAAALLASRPRRSSPRPPDGRSPRSPWEPFSPASCFGLRPQTAVALLPLAGVGRAPVPPRRPSGASSPRLLALASSRARSAFSRPSAALAAGHPSAPSSSRQAVYVRAEDSLRLADATRSRNVDALVARPVRPRRTRDVCFSSSRSPASSRRRDAPSSCRPSSSRSRRSRFPSPRCPAAPRYAVVLLPFPAALAALAFERLARRRGLRPPWLRRGARRRLGRHRRARPSSRSRPTRALPWRRSARFATTRRSPDGRSSSGRASRQHRRTFLPDRPAREIKEDDDRGRLVSRPRRHVGRRRLRPDAHPALRLPEPAPPQDLPRTLSQRLDRLRGPGRRPPPALARREGRLRLDDR